MNKTNKKTQLLGIELERLDKTKLSKRLTTLTRSENTSLVFTPNSEMLVNANIDKELFKILSSADLLIPDGFGLYAASRILGFPLPYRSTGIESGELLLDIATKHNLKIFFLGGKNGVAKFAAEQIKNQYPDLQIKTHHGYFERSKSSKENQAIIREILDFQTNIVFVCLGSPAQEKWIYENAPALKGVSLLIGLGGSLDVWSGNKKRAPTLFRRLGLEWLYRTATEPKRLKRLPSLFVFPLLVLKEKLSPKKIKVPNH